MLVQEQQLLLVLSIDVSGDMSVVILTSSRSMRRSDEQQKGHQADWLDPSDPCCMCLPALPLKSDCF